MAKNCYFCSVKFTYRNVKMVFTAEILLKYQVLGMKIGK